MSQFYLPTGPPLTAGELAALPDPIPGWLEPAVAFVRYWLGGSMENPDRGFVIHSSGSTGAPRPIRLKRAGITAAAEALGRALPLGATRLLAMSGLPLTSVGGLMAVARGLVWGADVWLAPPNAHPLAPWASRDGRVTGPGLVSLVPYQVALALDTPTERDLLAGLGVLLIGGGPLPAPLEDRLAVLSPVRVYHTYALTEATGSVALRDVTARQVGFVPLPDYQVAADPDGALQVMGPGTGGSWLTTTDALEWVDEPGGGFKILGRLDEAILVAGSKYHPESLEARLAPYLPGSLGRYQIVGIADPKLGQRIALAFEGGGPEDELIRLCQEAIQKALDEGDLTPRERPRALVSILPWPMTATGKTARRQVSDRAQLARPNSGPDELLPLT